MIVSEEQRRWQYAALQPARSGNKSSKSPGKRSTILAEPLGKVMLALTGIGLIGYILLRFAQALLDPEHKGTNAKGIAQRVGYLLSGLFYVGLALTSLRL